MSILEKTRKDRQYWEQLCQKLLQREWKMLIGGELVSSKSGKTYDTINPATGEFLAAVPFAEPEDVNKAVETAKKALKNWKKTPPIERGKYLFRLANALRERAEEFAVLDAVDSGNPVLAMMDDVERAAQNLEYAAGLATEIKGETIPSTGKHWHLSQREPYGVVARINPFNHPIGFTAQKIGMPLIAGNTLVAKAPDQPPLSSLLFCELVKEILPPGVVNIISGSGAVAGDALVRHPEIKRIALIGSVNTGKAILKSAAETGIKHVSLELGGKNAMMIFPDANMEEAVNGAFRGMNFLRSQGQSCGSLSRVFLHESIYDSFIEQLQQKAQDAKIGNPIDPDINMGCLISEEQFNKVKYYIKAGMEDGANLLVGGGSPELAECKNGYFIEPTIFTDVTPNMRIFKEEIFGPVQSIIKWKDYDHLIEMVNSVPYGLSASIWSNDHQQILSAVEDVEAGHIWVNGVSSHFIGCPFGGFKDSGLGSEEGIEELFSYTQPKMVHFFR